MPADRDRDRDRDSHRSSDAGDALNNGVIRACDQCRIRKIRCDKESPCSNCRIAQRLCSSTGAGQKPKEARQRVLISTQYERKIDQIEERLGGIEQLLRNLSTTGIQRGSDLPLHEPPAAAGLTPSVAGDTSSTAYDRDELDSAFEGNSSLTAHTVFASEFLEHAVERTSLRDLSPNMQAALNSLQQIVGMQNKASISHEVRFANQKPLPKGNFRELPMPPLQAVIPVLREIKETPPGTFTLISVCCFMAVENFAEACRQVYFALEDFSQATFIIVNAGLYYLFQEKAVLAESDAAVHEYTNYYELCRDNVETGLANLNLFMAASMENIEALLLGASYAIEVSRPSLAWQLNTTAAQLCQALGYHRAIPMATNNASGEMGVNDKKAILFWFTYMLDRGLALRLGRAPIIQDFDITLPRKIGKVNAPDFWKQILQLWIGHAEIQGRIYAQLYSPGSLSRPVNERIESAQVLAEELKRIANEAAIIRTEASANLDTSKATVTEMVMKSDEVSFLSSLTLVYRAIPSVGGFPGTFSPECIGTARAAMQTHQDCMRLMGTNSWVAASYIHWTILYAPFVPFIVIFCHIIETSNNVDDLHRLKEFIASLQPTCEVSEGVEKLHRLFQVLYNVALLYVEAKGQQDQDMAPIGNEFDVYLSALGFMPVDENGQTAGIDAAVPPAAAVNQTAQLGDWFSGNRYMVNLLEEDLSQFNPTVWTSGV